MTAVVIGLGAHGMEMVRALSWFGQMDDARGPLGLSIHVVDIDPTAEDRLRGECPGLFTCPARAASPRQGAAMTLTVHAGVDGRTMSLTHPGQLGCTPTFIFVATGDDDRNLGIAARLRRDAAREGVAPFFLLVARDSDALAAALAASSPGDSAGDIALLGDQSQVFARDVLLRSDLVAAGLLTHLAWVNHGDEVAAQDAERVFWTSEYHQASSLASPIAWAARRRLGTPGAQRSAPQRSASEVDALSRLEHARWEAFLFSEGFLFGKVRDLDVAKTHPLLVPYDSLDVKEQKKDENDYRDALQSIGRTPPPRSATVERALAEAIRVQLPGSSPAGACASTVLKSRAGQP